MGNYCASEVLNLEGKFSINYLFPLRENASQLIAEFMEWLLTVEKDSVSMINMWEYYQRFHKNVFLLCTEWER